MTSVPSVRRRVHLRIHGQVQGVGFRFHARNRGQALGLAGWVRNCQDGAVEAIAEGEQDAVGQFISWAHHGPSSAEVERVEVEDEEVRGESPPFRVRS